MAGCGECILDVFVSCVEMLVYLLMAGSGKKPGIADNKVYFITK